MKNLIPFLKMTCQETIPIETNFRGSAEKVVVNNKNVFVIGSPNNKKMEGVKLSTIQLKYLD